MEIASQIISIIALGASVFTLWFTVLRRGSVSCTHPSFIAFRYDFVGKKVPQAKIFLRTLLFSTAKRGWVVENLFLRVKEGGRSREFSFWGHGDKELVRGSGLFVPESGIVTNHHFNPLDIDELFEFLKGTYKLELMAKLVGREKLISLWTISLEVTENAFEKISPEIAIFFNWSAEEDKYIERIEHR